MIKADRMDTEKIIREALKEDLGAGDITTDAIIKADKRTIARIISKEDGILSGIGIAESVFREIDKDITFIQKKKDKDRISAGDTIAEITGSVKSIMKSERTALNFLGRMSGISTMTHKYQSQCRTAKILDTRKTTPLLRNLEKYAVKCGGGENHRMGLYDMILIKDNHIKAAGSITEALNQAKGTKAEIEIECETTEEVKEAIETGIPQRIMLDNMTEEDMAKAVEIIRSKTSNTKIEASGGMTLDRIKNVDKLGVDYISVGAITHSVKNHDFSLELED